MLGLCFDVCLLLAKMLFILQNPHVGRERLSFDFFFEQVIFLTGHVGTFGLEPRDR